MNKKIKYEDLKKFELRSCLEYFWIHLERLVKDTSGKELIQNFKNNLNPEEKAIFEKLYLLYFLEDKKIWEIFEEEKLKEFPEKIREKINKQSLEEKDQRWKKTKDKIEKEINNIPKSKLISFFNNFFYMVANWKSKQLLLQLLRKRIEWEEKINELLSRREFKKSKLKKPNTRRMFIKELLKIFAGKELEKYQSEYLEGVQRMERFNFFRRRFPLLNVNLDKELDLTKLQYNKKRYQIETKKTRHREFENIIEDGYPMIHIKENGQWRNLSLREYYEENIQKLSPEILRSKDLLDNIFVVYTIKRAQNGDKKALQKLYDCYIKTAEKKAVEFIRLKRYSLNLKFSEEGEFSEENVKSVAGLLLWTLLGGDPLEKFPYFLENKEYKEFRLTRKIDRILDKMIFSFSLFLEFEIKYISSEWERFKRKIKNLRYNLKKNISKNKKDSIANYLVKVYQVNVAYINFLETLLIAIYFSCDPYLLLTLSPSFNKFLFLPNRKTNLTTWLFGSGKWKGMFWQKLNDWYKSKTYVKSGRRLVKSSDLSSPEGVIYYTKGGKRKSRSKEEFLEDFSKEEDTFSIEELKELEFQNFRDEY